MSSTGTVKFFNNAKGYGFISPSDGSEDVFVHANDVTDQQVLMEGDEVQFDSVFDDRKGKTKASNVTGGSGGTRDFGGGGKGGGKGFGGGKAATAAARAATAAATAAARAATAA